MKEHLKDKRENDLQYEKMRDAAERFIAERYVSDGFYMHFHRNVELYCVCRGEVIVTVNGESKVLTDGQMALISGLESHSYEVDENADIAYFHIGTKYTAPFKKLYGKKVPARWLLDAEYNEKNIYPVVEKVMRDGDGMTELECVCYGNLALARIVNKYGFNKNCEKNTGGGVKSPILSSIFTTIRTPI